MRDRLASVRPLRPMPCSCLPANLVSRIASTLISFWPVSQPLIDFWNIMFVWGWRALFWAQGSVITLLCCCFLSKKFLCNHASCGFKEVIHVSDMIWNSGLLTFQFLFDSLLHPFFPAFKLFYLYLSNLSLPQHLFPLLLFIPRVLALALALCVRTSGYETAGWVSETSLSVWQSLWYISRPLPCIIDSLSLITVSSVTDEPLLPAAPALRGVFWHLKSLLRHNSERCCGFRATTTTTTTTTTGEVFWSRVENLTLKGNSMIFPHNCLTIRTMSIFKRGAASEKDFGKVEFMAELL